MFARREHGGPEDDEDLNADPVRQEGQGEKDRVPPDVRLEDLAQGGLFDVVDVYVEMPTDLDGIRVPIFALELPDPLHGQKPRRLFEPEAESSDYKRRYGSEQEYT